MLSHPGKFVLTVGLVESDVGNVAQPPGLCSSWLGHLKCGESVPVFIRANDYFHLPSDVMEPIILIATGTGLAPYMSFFNQRRVEKQNCGEITLYFGCRRSDHDYIYKEEIQKLLDANIISRHRVAFSREPSCPKTYVQDLLTADASTIYQQINEKNGHVFVCGYLEMAAEVEEQLSSILCQQGSMEPEDASEYIERMCLMKHYHKDIYNVGVQRRIVNE